MKLEPIYAVVNSDGTPELEVDGSLEQTVEAALGEYGRHTRIYFNGDLEQLQLEGAHRKAVQDTRQDNPGMADKALAALGDRFWDRRHSRPRIISLDEIYREFPDDREGVRQAFEVLRPYYPRKGDVKVVTSKAKGTYETIVGGTYDTPGGMSGAFLVANAKTKKAEAGLLVGETGGGATIITDEDIPPSLSKGLAFLPHALAKNPVFGFGGLPMLRETVGVCVGSSEECRKSCLVYAGQNQAVEHNNVVKGMRLHSFLEQPHAFMRMLIESTRRHVQACKDAGVVAYLRPNILSDIPIEALFPELWNVFPSAPFIYDYTKVGGREVSSLGKHAGGIDKYDLTFSFSGTNSNLMRQELDRGRRLAIVFLRGLKAGGKGKKGYKAPESFGDLRFMGQKVIDGDTHDLRPLDPQGTVVGLRFKALRGKSSGNRGEQVAKAGSFVVGGKGAQVAKHGKGVRVTSGLRGYAEGQITVISPEGKSGLAGTPAAHRFQGGGSKYVVEAFRTPEGHVIVAGTPRQQGVSEETEYGTAAE